MSLLAYEINPEETFQKWKKQKRSNTLKNSKSMGNPAQTLDEVHVVDHEESEIKYRLVIGVSYVRMNPLNTKKHKKTNKSYDDDCIIDSDDTLLEISSITSDSTFPNSPKLQKKIVHHSKKLPLPIIYIAFRGTDSPSDVLTNASCIPTLASKIGAGAFAHSGYYYNSQRFPHKYITALAEKFPIVLTGHSLGGSIATITALSLINQFNHKRTANAWNAPDQFHPVIDEQRTKSFFQNIFTSDTPQIPESYSHLYLSTITFGALPVLHSTSKAFLMGLPKSKLEIFHNLVSTSDSLFLGLNILQSGAIASTTELTSTPWFPTCIAALQAAITGVGISTFTNNSAAILFGVACDWLQSIYTGKKREDIGLYIPFGKIFILHRDQHMMVSAPQHGAALKSGLKLDCLVQDVIAEWRCAWANHSLKETYVHAFDVDAHPTMLWDIKLLHEFQSRKVEVPKGQLPMINEFLKAVEQT
ncbi:hypothetical protein HK098_007816 [Nowakowskiella sp. JEL0407]|nr:hypothetical protein HK098_007816 [Nowakowskiella sp. JEL0407]